MVMRVLLCLLLAALGCQAMATECHDAPAMRMAMVAHPAMPAQHQHDTAAPHACIGCIPPESLRANALDAPVAARALPALPTLKTLATASGTPPALPPPRA